MRRNILLLAKNSPPRLSGNGKKTLLVLGGSQGARAVNRLVTEGLQSLPDTLLAGFRVIHQTGEQDVQAVKAGYAGRGIEALVQPFFTDMAEIYNQADLMVTRAGATTLAEIAVLGKPAILIPYPSAADNHQEKNANHYAAGGGVVVLRQHELTAGKLAENIRKLIYDEDKLLAMGTAMKKLAFPDAAEKIVACCLEVMQMKGN